MNTIEENRRRFRDLINTVKRPGKDKLLEFIEASDFYRAPASTRYHLSIEGGLLQHSLDVYDALMDLAAEDISEEPNGIPSMRFMSGGSTIAIVSKETIIITALLHDLCKTNFYEQELRWKKDDNNKWVQYAVYAVNDRNPYGHGEKSAMMAAEFIHLTMEERYAIRWHMGMDSGVGTVGFCQSCEKYPLVLYLHFADQIATHFMETETGLRDIFELAGRSSANMKPGSVSDSDADPGFQEADPV